MNASSTRSSTVVNATSSRFAADRGSLTRSKRDRGTRERQQTTTETEARTLRARAFTRVVKVAKADSMGTARDRVRLPEIRTEVAAVADADHNTHTL
jgi:hypothetical protein